LLILLSVIKVAQHIATRGTESYKNLLAQAFNIGMLKDFGNEGTTPVLFDCWRGKDMNNWYKFTNDDGVILEIYPEYYLIKKPSSSEKLSLPLSLNDFITDMLRHNVQLYWAKWIDENLEPMDYLPVNEIPNYYVELLKKMGKSHELNI